MKHSMDEPQDMPIEFKFRSRAFRQKAPRSGSITASNGAEKIEPVRKKNAVVKNNGVKERQKEFTRSEKTTMHRLTCPVCLAMLVHSSRLSGSITFHIHKHLSTPVTGV